MEIGGLLTEEHWKKYPDLYDNLDFLLRHGYGRGDIGILYLNFAMRSFDELGAPIERQLSSFANEKRLRKLKRSYQEGTREYFAAIKSESRDHNIEALDLVGNIDLEALKSEALVRFARLPCGMVERSMAGLLHLPDTVQYLGAGLLRGSKTYMRDEKGGLDTLFTPSLFKEYNDICAAYLRISKKGA